MHIHVHTNHASCLDEPNKSRQDALPCSVAALAFPLFHSFSFQTLGKRVGPAASCQSERFVSYLVCYSYRYVTSYVTLRAYAVFAQCSSNFIQQYANIDGQYQQQRIRCRCRCCVSIVSIISSSGLRFLLIHFSLVLLLLPFVYVICLHVEFCALFYLPCTRFFHLLAVYLLCLFSFLFVSMLSTVIGNWCILLNSI